MKVRADIAGDRQGEIDAVLQDIAIGPNAGQWQSLPNRIELIARLAGDRSQSDVFEAVVVRGNQQSRKVIKIGPLEELRDEFRAFQQLIHLW